MLPPRTNFPRRFSSIAFAVIGFVFGLLQTAPWSSEGLYLMTNTASKVFWPVLISMAASCMGYRYGDAFVRNARTRRFAAAAGIVAGTLVASVAVTMFVYCLALVVSGDFGMSVGIFGSFQPSNVFQRLLGTVMVFIIGFLATLLRAIFIGFVGGYVTALLFDRDY